MCAPDVPATGEDQWFMRNPRLEAFIDLVNQTRQSFRAPEEILARLRTDFGALVRDPAWLPEKFRLSSAQSGMGGGIGMWLLYRAGDGGLALSALVVPSGAATPVHDHLTWGLVGLCQGRQRETVYRRSQAGEPRGQATLAVVEELELAPGDCYDLLPHNDIHQVLTTSAETSVSLHLLGNDNGCTWRNQYDPEASSVTDFRSGWLNAECREY